MAFISGCGCWRRAASMTMNWSARPSHCGQVQCSGRALKGRARRDLPLRIALGRIVDVPADLALQPRRVGHPGAIAQVAALEVGTRSFLLHPLQHLGQPLGRSSRSLLRRRAGDFGHAADFGVSGMIMSCALKWVTRQCAPGGVDDAAVP